MKFCVFSFNRGRFLENLIGSIRRCVGDGADIVVVDDNSDEAETCRILRDIEKDHRVIRPDVSAGKSRHGGLYHNKNLVLSHLGGEDIVCFTHDDTQVVREISVDDVADIQKYFSLNPNTAFLRPSFFKGKNNKVHRTNENIYWDAARQAYFYRRRHCYQDVSVIHVGRLFKNNWQFRNSEGENRALAESVFGETGVMKNPFLHYLPNAPAYRLGHKTFVIGMMEKIYNGGLYPFEVMSDSDAQAFVCRDPNALPVAENFLSLRGQPAIKKPWDYDIRNLNKPLKWLHGAEMAVRRLF